MWAENIWEKYVSPEISFSIFLTCIIFFTDQTTARRNFFISLQLSLHSKPNHKGFVFLWGETGRECGERAKNGNRESLAREETVGGKTITKDPGFEIHLLCVVMIHMFLISSLCFLIYPYWLGSNLISGFNSFTLPVYISDGGSLLIQVLLISYNLLSCSWMRRFDCCC